MTNYRNRFQGASSDTLGSIDKDRRKKLFENKFFKIVAPQTSDLYLSEAESEKFVEAYLKQKSRYIPNIDYKDPATFAYFGSAEKYYHNSIKNIYNTYPYDGSRAEKMEWAVSASFLDLYMLEHEYPKTTGHIEFHRSTITSNGAPYFTSESPKYIKFFGGPQVGTVYNESKNRESNIKIDGTKGNTVEFWLKKSSNSWPGTARKEVLLDINSSNDPAFAEYGRLTVELQNPANVANSPFMFTYTSGSTGTSTSGLRLGSAAVTKASVSDGKWHHYAITAQTSGSVTVFKFFVDGKLDHTTTGAYTLGPVTTPLSGTIGASTANGASILGNSQLSASLDEFRYWKTARTEKEIGRFWCTPVHGGTDKDHTNASLGLYYKFNEGITGEKDYDKVVLDYSGRINNGLIVNWDTTMRESESAIDQSENTPDSSFKEPLDPIVNPQNNLIINKIIELKDKGAAYDRNNGSSLARTVPSYFSEEDDILFAELLQIMASSFDDLFLKIKNLPKIKNINYEDFFREKGQYRKSQEGNFLLGCESETLFEFTGDHKRPWMSHILEHYGMVSTEIFSNANVFENFLNRTEEVSFEHDLEDAKREILSNIHKNLIYIFKTKGTEEGFRNLIRCFGVDDELIKLKSYGNNEEYELIPRPTYTSIKQKSINFEEQNHQGTVYQTAASAGFRPYITGSTTDTPFTLDANIIFPKKTELSQYKQKAASLFGMHSVLGSGDPANPLQFHPQDSGSFQVRFVKRTSDSPDGYFELKSSTGVINTIASPYIPGVYENTHWNISVRIGAKSDIDFNLATANPAKQYLVEFSGYSYDLDILRDSFHVSTTISDGDYRTISSQDKAVFIGSHKTNFTGTHLESSDVRVLAFNVWKDCLSESELKEHAKNPQNYGRTQPQSISNFDSGKNLLSADSLILRWQFENLTGSDDSGIMAVDDYSSGSTVSIYNDDVTGFLHAGKAVNLPHTSSAIFQEFMPVVKYDDVDNIYSSDKVTIKSAEIDKFKPSSRPVTYFYNFEKSMYQVISQEMVNFFADVVGYGNLIGEPVNKYRHNYKLMEKIRNRFFLKVNNTPDFDKFVEYYKWVDESLSHFLEQLIPASSRFGSGIKDVVESHMLERNKYRHKAPTVEFKDPADKIYSILSVNELLYDWKHGHGKPTTFSTQPGTTGTGEIFFNSQFVATYNNKKIVITNAANVTKTFIFDSSNTEGATGTVDGSGFIVVQINGMGNNLNGIATQLATAISGVAGFGISVANNGFGGLTLTQTGAGGSIANPDSIQDAAITQFSGGSNSQQVEDRQNEATDCLWRKERQEVSPDRQKIKEVATTVVSGSTYATRRLVKPYRFTGNYQKTIAAKSNRNANKKENLYKMVNQGEILEVERSSLREAERCYDNSELQTKTVLNGRIKASSAEGLYNVDSDYMFPFTMVSSSAGTDFPAMQDVFVRIANNHQSLDISGEDSLKGPFTRTHVGGMPHRKYAYRGLTTHSPDRPEAYNITVQGGTKIKLEKTDASKSKSMFFRRADGTHFMNISNILFGTSSVSIGNYQDVYQVVMTNGRLINNNVTSLPVTTVDENGITNFPVIQRPKNRHVVVNKFSAPGSSDSMSAAGLDPIAGELSVYNTLNYRNSLVREIETALSSEISDQFGLRKGTSDNGSIHKTNRNPTKYYRGLSLDEKKYDNFFVQHPIPTNDYGYSWITASATDSVYSFLERNNNYGHQHMFSRRSNMINSFRVQDSNGFQSTFQGAPLTTIGTDFQTKEAQDRHDTFSLIHSSSEAVRVTRFMFDSDVGDNRARWRSPKNTSFANLEAGENLTALSFPGTPANNTTFVEVPDHDDWTFGHLSSGSSPHHPLCDFTIAFWMKNDPQTSNIEEVISKRNTSISSFNFTEWGVEIDNRSNGKRLVLTVSDHSPVIRHHATFSTVIGNPIVDNKWRHYIISYNSQTKKVQFYLNGSTYYNGQSNPAITGSHGFNDPENWDETRNTNNTLGIGGNSVSLANFSGQLSNVMIFKHDGASGRSADAFSSRDAQLLVEDYIQYNANDTTSQAVVQPDKFITGHPKYSDLVGWWKLDGNGNASVGGASKNGTVGNLVTTVQNSGLLRRSRDPSFTISFWFHAPTAQFRTPVEKADEWGVFAAGTDSIVLRLIDAQAKLVASGQGWPHPTFNRYQPVAIDYTFTNARANLSYGWHQYVVTYDAPTDTAKIYVDGNYIVSGTKALATTYSNQATNASLSDYYGMVSGSGFHVLNSSSQDTTFKYYSNLVYFRHDGVDGRSNKSMTANDVKDLYNKGVIYDYGLHDKFDDIIEYRRLDDSGEVFLQPDDNVAYTLIDSDGGNTPSIMNSDFNDGTLQSALYREAYKMPHFMISWWMKSPETSYAGYVPIMSYGNQWHLSYNKVFTGGKHQIGQILFQSHGLTGSSHLGAVGRDSYFLNILPANNTPPADGYYPRMRVINNSHTSMVKKTNHLGWNHYVVIHNSASSYSNRFKFYVNGQHIQNEEIQHQNGNPLQPFFQSMGRTRPSSKFNILGTNAHYQLHRTTETGRFDTSIAQVSLFRKDPSTSGYSDTDVLNLYGNGKIQTEKEFYRPIASRTLAISLNGNFNNAQGLSELSHYTGVSGSYSRITEERVMNDTRERSSQTIKFLTASHHASDFIDFAGMNFYTTSSTGPNAKFIDEDTNKLDYSGSVNLNSQILNTQGPYGWPSWKQARTGDHPVARLEKNKNFISISVRQQEPIITTLGTEIERPEDIFPSPFPGVSPTQNIHDPITDINDSKTRDRKIRRYKEVMTTNRFNPITITLHNATSRDLLVSTLSQEKHESYWINDESSLVSLGEDFALSSAPLNTRMASVKVTYGNDVTKFANRRLTKKLDLVDRVSNILPDSILSSLGVVSLQQAEIASTEVNYIEAVYPREINTFSKQARIRENFDFYGWNSTRTLREVILSGSNAHQTKIFSVSEGSNKLFPKVSKNNLEDKATNGFLVDVVDMGDLTSNDKTLTHIVQSKWPLDARKDYHDLPINLTASFIQTGPSFLSAKESGTRGEGVLQNDYSIFGLGYNAVHGTPPPAMVYNRRVPQKIPNTGAKATELMSFPSNNTVTDGKFITLTDVEGTTVTFEFDTGNVSNPVNVRVPIGSTNVFNALTAFHDAVNAHAIKITASNLDNSSVTHKKVTLTQDLAGPAGNTSIAQNINGSLTFVFAGGAFSLGEYLAGEAKWEAADQAGEVPFEDTFEKHSENYRQLGQDHSLVPEFLISDHVEKVLSENAGNYEAISEYENLFSLTGAVYNVSSKNITTATNFYKTYSTSDFMKYFGVVTEAVETSDMGQLTKMTLRCKAALKFTPYRGFYPAERVVQIGELFSRGYMSDTSFDILDSNSSIVLDPADVIRRKIRANLQQSMKPLFAPGVLMNSIKCGMAVDYPLFGSAADDAAIEQYNTRAREKTVDEVYSQNFDTVLTTMTMFKGSIVNNTPDSNPKVMPRLSGSTYKRVTFDDLLNPEDLIGTKILDQEPHPSASIYYGDKGIARVFDYPFTFGELDPNNNIQSSLVDNFSLTRPLEDTLKPYRLAVNNFCAETVNFFLKDGKVATLESTEAFPYLEQNKTYKMRVYIRNSGIQMYDRHSAFGPPVDDGTGLQLTTITEENVFNEGSKAEAKIMPSYNLINYQELLSDPSLADAPVTASAFSPNAYADLPRLAITGNVGGTQRILRVNLFRYENSFKPWTHHGSTENAMRLELSDFQTTNVTKGNGSSADFDPSIHGKLYLHETSATSKDLYLDITSLQDQQHSTAEGIGIISKAIARNNNFAKLVSGSLMYLSASGGTKTIGVTPSRNSSNTYGSDLFLRQDQDGSDYNYNLGTENQFAYYLQLVIPENFTGGQVAGPAVNYVTSSTTINNSHGYAPFRPPFLDPGSDPYAEISFTPPAGGSRHYSLREIQDKAVYSYHNFYAEPNNASDNTNYQQAMSITASLDLKGFTIYPPSENNTDPDRLKRYRWLIQTKWETPVMDFSKSKVTALTYDRSSETATDTISTVTLDSSSPWQPRRWQNYFEPSGFQSSDIEYVTSSVGMWHQYGRIPASDNQGYTLEVRNITGLDPDLQLAPKVGFKKQDFNTKAKIGEISDKKIVSEAIVAIPFVEPPAGSGPVKYFKVKEEVLSRAKEYNEALKNEYMSGIIGVPPTDRTHISSTRRYMEQYNNPGQSPVESIAYQMRMMEKFIMPPQFDYMANRNRRDLNLNPSTDNAFMMYIFQFNMELNQDDLKNIWQNLPPTSEFSTRNLKYASVNRGAGFSGTAQDIQYVSNFMPDGLCPYENNPFLNRKDVRWLIFKVKQRAEFDLIKVKKNSIPEYSNLSRPIEDTSVAETSELVGKSYSYNWPYDFFSFVELIKMEAKFDYYKGVNLEDIRSGE